MRTATRLVYGLWLALSPALVEAQDKSVNPGINQSFKDPDVPTFVERFEKEGRDVFDHREEVVRALRLKPGMVVADIGAGTGLFTRMFAAQVGEQGKVFAVDISEKFVRHVEAKAKEAGQTNIAGVVCQPDRVDLPAGSVDLVFICDTYHHFEFPQKTMESLRQALKPDGQVVLIDFHRIPGKSSEWTLGHVRAGQEVFAQEVVDVGFRQVESLPELLSESYFLRFVKTDRPAPADKPADKAAPPEKPGDAKSATPDNGVGLHLNPPRQRGATALHAGSARWASGPARRTSLGGMGRVSTSLARRVEIGPAEQAPQGILVHRVDSDMQSKPTDIRVLPPPVLEQQSSNDAPATVVYLLPVEAGRESRYGDGLEEVLRLSPEARRGLAFVAPSFAELPWFADHPTREDLRQESYFVDVVVPFVERQYRIGGDMSRRWLVGFSKSGWGAWSLLIRHPDLFARAAAWDAPLRMDHPQFGSAPIFGDTENFQRYRIDRALESRPAPLSKSTRLVLLGYGNFREQHVATHLSLDALSIPHVYRDGPARKHDWHSGWVAEALDALRSVDG